MMQAEMIPVEEQVVTAFFGINPNAIDGGLTLTHGLPHFLTSLILIFKQKTGILPNVMNLFEL
jgi:hypothetical protein